MRSISILHLSDVHYGSEAAFLDDNKAQVNPALRSSAFRNLDLLLKDCFLETKFDSIVVSGDSTTRGSSEGFQSFLTHTAPLLAKVITDPQSVCVVAGNHDVTWDLDSRTPDYFDRKFESYSTFIKKLGATSCLVPTGTVPDSPYDEVEFSSELPGPLYVNDKKQLIILCINSSIRCGEVNAALRDSLSTPIRSATSVIEKLIARYPNDRDICVPLQTANYDLTALLGEVQRSTLFDIPHVTQTQLNKIRSLLNTKRNDLKREWVSYVKIAVFHHHVVPFNYQQPEYKPFEIMADSAAVLDTMGSFGFQIILTGHKHQPYVQPLKFRGIDLLVSGGMTIGGHPVPGCSQGVRQLQIERSDGHTNVRIADLPCDWQGDLPTRVTELINSATCYTLEHASPIRRISFPQRIESAVDEQLYRRSFYRTDVLFDVDIVEVDDQQLRFTTALSYGVVNHTSQRQEWATEYAYNQTTGKILEAKFNDRPFDPDDPEFRTGRGIKIPFPLKGNETGQAYIKAEEFFPSQGAYRYTSYYPATDLTVILTMQAPSFEFDTQVLYFWDNYPADKKPGRIEVHFDRGLLPYQGLQLNWKRKEKVR